MKDKQKVVMNKVAGMPAFAFYMTNGWKRVDNLKERCHICGYPSSIIWKVKHPEAHVGCREEYYLCEVCLGYISILHDFDNHLMRSYLEETERRLNVAYTQGKKDGEANKEAYAKRKVEEALKKAKTDYIGAFNLGCKAGEKRINKQKQIEFAEDVLKEYKKRDKDIPIMPKYMRDLDFDKFLKQRIKELKKK